MSTTRKRWRADGLCVACGKTKQSKRFVNCDKCRRKQVIGRRAWLAEKAAAGLCQQCGRNKSNGGFRCKQCAEKSKDARVADKLKRRCTKCHKNRAAKAHSLCDPCRNALAKYMARLQDEREKKGLCVKCQQPYKGPNRHCQECLSERNRETATNKKRGLCLRCKAPVASTVYCENCLRLFRVRTQDRLDLLRKETFAEYGGKCVCCGEKESMFLNIDHIKGGGALHRKTVSGRKGGTTFYAWLKRQGYPKGFQVMCFNCNFGKWRNGGTCPHQLNR